MSFLGELRTKKEYQSVLELIKKEEQHNKNKIVVPAEEVFRKCYSRYLRIQKILLPLKLKLGERVDVTDISFSNGMQEDTAITIKYEKEGKPYVLGLSSSDYEDINIISSDVVVQQEYFVDHNKDIIIDAIKGINNDSLSDQVTLKSTSGIFTIIDNCDSFLIRDTDNRILSMEGKYSTYAKTGNFFNPAKLVCNYPKLKEVLLENGGALFIYQHLLVYEDDLPNVLTKKLTNS